MQRSLCVVRSELIQMTHPPGWIRLPKLLDEEECKAAAEDSLKSGLKSTPKCQEVMRMVLEVRVASFCLHRCADHFPESWEHYKREGRNPQARCKTSWSGDRPVPLEPNPRFVFLRPSLYCSYNVGQIERDVLICVT
jgi:hypothetical protein